MSFYRKSNGLPGFRLARVGVRIAYAGVLAASFSGGVQAEKLSHSFQVTSAEVQKAIVAAHPELDGASIELPARIEARVQNPALNVGAVQPEGARDSSESRALVRLGCRNESVCLPFYATVHMSAAQAAAAMPALAEIRSSSAAYGGNKAPAIRAGQHALLLMDSGPVHIHVPVTCLQSGEVGAVIRVESSTRVAGELRRQIYKAAVVNDSLVRGSL